MTAFAEIFKTSPLSTADLAYRVGKSPRMIDYYLSGDWTPSISLKAQIADELGCTVDMLWPEED